MDEVNGLLLMTVNDYIDNVSARFATAELHFGHGTGNARDEAIYLIYSVLDIDFSIDSSALQQELSQAQFKSLEELVLKRVTQKIPVAYLIEEAWFAGRRFICDERALIPRSPIAELIQKRFEPLLKEQPRRILDMCCGGGCIGIACALEFPNSCVDLVDVSIDCLHLAEENISLHGLEDRVFTIHSNLFEKLSTTYDLILSNPPYVSKQDIEFLPTEYRYEPIGGLLSEAEGLDIPLRILRDAAAHLNKTGSLIMEVGVTSEKLSKQLKEVPLLWLAFDSGGEGIFALGADELRAYSNGLN